MPFLKSAVVAIKIYIGFVVVHIIAGAKILKISTLNKFLYHINPNTYDFIATNSSAI
jgi:hypothetical protein